MLWLPEAQQLRINKWPFSRAVKLKDRILVEGSNNQPCQVKYWLLIRAGVRPHLPPLLTTYLLSSASSLLLNGNFYIYATANPLQLCTSPARPASCLDAQHSATHNRVCHVVEWLEINTHLFTLQERNQLILIVPVCIPFSPFSVPPLTAISITTTLPPSVVLVLCWLPVHQDVIKTRAVE